MCILVNYETFQFMSRGTVPGKCYPTYYSNFMTKETFQMSEEYVTTQQVRDYHATSTCLFGQS